MLGKLNRMIQWLLYGGLILLVIPVILRRIAGPTSFGWGLTGFAGGLIVGASLMSRQIRRGP
jgi:hypothetical protein